MVRERQGEQLETWLEAAKASQLAALTPFVTSLQQDKDAVLAALTLRLPYWSVGRTHQSAQTDQKTGLWARKV